MASNLEWGNVMEGVIGEAGTSRNLILIFISGNRDIAGDDLRLGHRARKCQSVCSLAEKIEL